MDKISFISFLIISIPEEFLFTITTAFLVGKKGLLKSKNGWVSVLIATLLTAMVTVVFRSNSDNVLVNIIAQLIFFVLIYIVVLKMNKTEAAVGFTLVLLYQFIIEIANAVIVTNLTNIGLEQVYKSDMIRFLHSLPARVLQLSAALALLRLPFALSLKDITFTKKVKFNYSMIYLCVALAVVNITFVLKKYIYDSSIYQSIHEPFLWVNLIFTVTIIITIMKFIKDIKHEKREQIIKLAWVKDLLVQCNGDIIEVNKRIDEMIENLGGKQK